jgi:hypothetical protein
LFLFTYHSERFPAIWNYLPLAKFKYLFTGIYLCCSNIYNIFIKYIVLYDEIRIKHRERCTLASRIYYINDFKNTYVVESWLIVYFKKEKHGELGGSWPNLYSIECSPLLVTNVKKEITSLWPNSNICLQVFISVVVTFIIYLLNTLYFMYKIGKSPTPEGKISIVLFTRLAELENDYYLTLGCRRFPYLVLFPVFDFISH